MSLTLTTKPQREPLSLDEVKEHLRIAGNDSDSELIGLIQEARVYVENITGRALITQTWQWKMDDLPTSLKIPRPPLQSVSSVSYQDVDNATQTLASSNYTVDTNSEPGRLVQSFSGSYPSTYTDLDAVTITFISGYGDDPEDVPEIFKRSMKLYIEKMYDMTNAAYGEALNSALEATLLHHKVEWFAL